MTARELIKEEADGLFPKRLLNASRAAALVFLGASCGAGNQPIDAATVAQESTKATQKKGRKTVFCRCGGFPGSAGLPRFSKRQHFLRNPMDILIPHACASVVMPVAEEWVIGEGDSLEQAKKNARKNCKALLVKSGRQGEYVETGGCFEGSFVARCECKKTEPHKKDPDKIELKKTSWTAGGYTEKEAVSKAKQNCINSLSASSSRTIYDKDKFKNSFKGWKADCSLEVKNKQIL